ncbi:MAG: hypothetical protein DCC58_12725, partial [Chloroflexi bacterium]
FADVYCHSAALDVGVDGPIHRAVTITGRGIRNHLSVLTRIRQALEARYLQHPVCNITLATGNIVPPLPLRPADAGAFG